MNFAEAQEIERQVKEARVENWVVRLVTPKLVEHRQMPKTNPDRRVFGFFPPDMLDGATVYAAGAIPALTQGYSVVPFVMPREVPQPQPKRRKR